MFSRQAAVGLSQDVQHTFVGPVQSQQPIVFETSETVQESPRRPLTAFFCEDAVLEPKFPRRCTAVDPVLGKRRAREGADSDPMVGRQRLHGGDVTIHERVLRSIRRVDLHRTGRYPGCRPGQGDVGSAGSTLGCDCGRSTGKVGTHVQGAVPRSCQRS